MDTRHEENRSVQNIKKQKRNKKDKTKQIDKGFEGIRNSIPNISIVENIWKVFGKPKMKTLRIE